MSREIAGILPIAHTPFTQRDEIDWESLERQADWAFQTGADGYCTGMVSELLRLTSQERGELTQRLVELAEGRGVMVASVGGESLQQALQYVRQAERAGCDAMMAAPPISTALPAEALIQYFGTLAEAIDVPLIVQDASAYVGKAIPIDVCTQLLDRYGADKIFFKPEAAPIGPNLSRLRDETRGRARIFEGSGGILLVDSFRRGIAGTMPGMEMLDGIVRIWKAMQEQDDETAYQAYFPICAIVALQMQAGLDGFLAIEKYVLKRRGIFLTDYRRQPNSWQLDAETQAEIDRLLDRAGWGEWGGASG